MAPESPQPNGPPSAPVSEKIDPPELPGRESSRDDQPVSVVTLPPKPTATEGDSQGMSGHAFAEGPPSKESKEASAPSEPNTSVSTAPSGTDKTSTPPLQSGQGATQKPSSVIPPSLGPFQQTMVKRPPTAFERTVLKDVARPPKGRISTMATVALVTLGLVMLQFVSVDVPHISELPMAIEAQMADGSLGPLPELWPYGFQIPACLALGAILGPTYGVLALFLFAVLGFTGLPVFGSGTGFAMVNAPSVGYWLGILGGTFWMGMETRVWLRKTPLNTVRLLRLMASAVMAVCAVHVVGMLGLVIQSLFHGWPWSWVEEGIYAYTLYPLPYDLLVSLAVVALIRPFRSLLWLVLY